MALRKAGGEIKLFRNGMSLEADREARAKPRRLFKGGVYGTCTNIESYPLNVLSHYMRKASTCRQVPFGGWCMDICSPAGCSHAANLRPPCRTGDVDTTCE